MVSLQIQNGIPVRINPGLTVPLQFFKKEGIRFFDTFFCEKIFKGQGNGFLRRVSEHFHGRWTGVGIAQDLQIEN